MLFLFLPSSWGPDQTPGARLNAPLPSPRPQIDSFDPAFFRGRLNQGPAFNRENTIIHSPGFIFTLESFLQLRVISFTEIKANDNRL